MRLAVPVPNRYSPLLATIVPAPDAVTPAMKLDRENTTGNLIRRFTGREIHVGDQVFRQPVIITIEQLIADWSPPPVTALRLADLEAAIALEPEVILLGTGQRQQFPPATLTTAILQRGIGIEVMDTAAACRTFNILAAEYRRVAAVLYLD